MEHSAEYNNAQREKRCAANGKQVGSKWEVFGKFLGSKWEVFGKQTNHQTSLHKT